MAVRPSPDRSDLESKTREDSKPSQGKRRRRVGARFKASLIEAIMGDPAPPTMPRFRFTRRTLATHRRDTD